MYNCTMLNICLKLSFCIVGGSFMNILAVNIARHKACPEIKTAGLYGQKRLKIYVSAEVRICT